MLQSFELFAVTPEMTLLKKHAPLAQVLLQVTAVVPVSFVRMVLPYVQTVKDHVAYL